MKKTAAIPYHPVVKAVFYLQILAGICWVSYLLWTGIAVIPKTFGGDVYLIDSHQQPFSFWFLVVGIVFSLIGLPLKLLRDGGVPQKPRAGS